MKKEIMPKLPRKFPHSKDLRLGILNKWKDLFEEVHKDIKVYLYTEEIFREVLEETYGDISFSSDCRSDVRIIVILPKELELEYLVGLTYDRMFSHREVLSDPLLSQNYTYPCEPEFFKWEKLYYDICEISEEIKKEIPYPPAS